uniref:Secreted protein n=1 Tax=Xenopus tropicalis TaxID=8364 RepID=A0A803JMW8_XENTR
MTLMSIKKCVTLIFLLGGLNKCKMSKREQTKKKSEKHCFKGKLSWENIFFQNTSVIRASPAESCFEFCFQKHK